MSNTLSPDGVDSDTNTNTTTTSSTTSSRSSRSSSDSAAMTLTSQGFSSLIPFSQTEDLYDSDRYRFAGMNQKHSSKSSNTTSIKTSSSNSNTSSVDSSFSTATSKEIKMTVGSRSADGEVSTNETEAEAATNLSIQQIKAQFLKRFEEEAEASLGTSKRSSTSRGAAKQTGQPSPDNSDDDDDKVSTVDAEEDELDEEDGDDVAVSQGSSYAIDLSDPAPEFTVATNSRSRKTASVRGAVGGDRSGSTVSSGAGAYDGYDGILASSNYTTQLEVRSVDGYQGTTTAILSIFIAPVYAYTYSTHCSYIHLYCYMPIHAHIHSYILNTHYSINMYV